MHNITLSSQQILSYLDLSYNPDELFNLARECRRHYSGRDVYLRGLIELTNICEKDCYYCGIRQSNFDLNRYQIEESELFQCIEQADRYKFGSLVIQTGEQQSERFTDLVEGILLYIQKKYPHIAVTLSCGEQSYDIYQRWFKAGATRYLLRIETSNENLFSIIHPNNAQHSFKTRLECLRYLRDIGYQVGSGVMIGIPGQTPELLMHDLLFLKEIDIDMCGMGPYIEHDSTPLYEEVTHEHLIQRANLTLRMIALLRVVMKDINIAATTALETIDSQMRFQAFDIGANVVMPNLTPAYYREDYNLYNGKQSLVGSGQEICSRLNLGLDKYDLTLALDEKGTSKHFFNRHKEALC